MAVDYAFCLALIAATLSLSSKRNQGEEALGSSLSSSMGLLLLLLLTFGIFPVSAQQQALLADYAFDSSLLPFSGICPTPTYLSQPTATALGGVTYAASKTGFGQALFVPLPGGTFVGLL